VGVKAAEAPRAETSWEAFRGPCGTAPPQGPTGERLRTAGTALRNLLSSL